MTVLLLLLTLASPADAETPASELAARRAEAVKRFADGILLLHARPGMKGIDEGQFRQDRGFYYLTGLGDAMNALLALDGPRKESWLFVPPAGRFRRAEVAPGPETAARLGLDHVVAWEDLVPYLDRRLQEGPPPILYTENGGFTGMALGSLSNPPGLDPIDNRFLLFPRALAARWPKAVVRPADALDHMRSVKSPYEIEALRRVGRASATALLAGLQSLVPGRAQRESEASVVSACLAAGAEGPSFWPWVMTGPNAAFPAPFEAFADYRHLNRAMAAGEVARVDVGCALDHYEGDVGRTAPVSGRFDPGQRETWELLVAAYRAGLATVRDGVRAELVIAASLREVAARRDTLKTTLGRRAAEELLGKDGTRYWEIHGVGLDSAEGQPRELRAGMVVAFEPIFSVEGLGFYLEDMVLVTGEGHEILTPGLPYSADEIEAATGVSSGRRRSP
jgi:Xaa-Pro aminopeptidase